MNDEVHFKIGPTILLNQWLRLNRWAKHRYLESLAWKVKAVVVIPPAPFTECVISVRRHSAKLPDWDGLYGGLKPLLDVLGPFHNKVHPFGLGIIADDNPTCVRQLTAEPVLCKPRAGFTEVWIDAVSR